MKQHFFRFSTAVSGLSGFQRNLAAFCFGICGTLTLPPFFLFPLLIPAFTGLYWLVEGAATRKRVFWDGWWWGWGYYISGLYWFCIALLTDAGKFGWLIPFALFGITGVIAIYPALACLFLTLTRTNGLTRLFTFSVIWVLVEFARGHLLSGFPWNLMGYSFSFSDASLQLASQVGIYGLTWCAAMVGLAAAPLGLTAIFPKRGRFFAVAVYTFLFASVAWGQWRLLHAGPATETVPGVMLRLVQGNTPALPTASPQLQAKGLNTYLRLTRAPGLERVSHVIWPESSVSYVLQAGSPLANTLGAGIPAGKLLITGALRAEGDNADWQVWNSMVALDHNGNIQGIYDKAKLVPFGEFLPFRQFLPPSWLTPVGTMDFSAGPGIQTVNWPGLPPASPLICYEAIFPERATDKLHRPAMLLNLTNDAWFGQSTGPYQHFQMSRMRAVEQGIPLVRVANTGISAIIDPYGRIVQSLGLGKQGILDIALPVGLTITTFVQYNNLFLLLLVSICAILILKQILKHTNQ